VVSFILDQIKVSSIAVAYSKHTTPEDSGLGEGWTQQTRGQCV
jgi:hypothetical protein